MNVILIISDTVRHDYLGCYGNPWVHTPHIDHLAERSAVMTRSFAASFPTGPMRKDVHAGRFTFTYTNWAQDRPPGELLLAELLAEARYLTAYIGDTSNSRQYMSGFEYTEIVPSAASRLDEVPDSVPLPADPRKLRHPTGWVPKIIRNSLGWDGEADRRVARTMLAAHRWLEDRSGDDRPFFLWVDTFDPHEPWDPPRYYIDLYDRAYRGDELVEPAYEPAQYATEDEIRHMRCLYAAKLTMVDRWLGFLLEGLERMPLAAETAIIFTSDHGFYHGEHGLIGKVHLARDDAIIRRWPLYETITHVPLLIHLPGVANRGRRIAAFCQPPDLTPTILDLCAVAIPPPVQGASLLPIVHGESRPVRDFAVSSTTFAQDAEVRSPSSLRTAQWLYVYGGDEWPSELYDLKADPGETRNVFDEHRDVARQLHHKYVEFLEQVDCPGQSLELRRPFDPTPRPDLPQERII